MSDSVLQQQYQEFCDRKLSLNIERGQPADENFDLSLPIFTAIDETNYITCLLYTSDAADE